MRLEHNFKKSKLKDVNCTYCSQSITGHGKSKAIACQNAECEYVIHKTCEELCPQNCGKKAKSWDENKTLKTFKLNPNETLPADKVTRSTKLPFVAAILT